MDYWHKSGREPIAVRRVVYVDALTCGGDTDWACINYATGRIEIKADLRPDQKMCALAHEYKHAAGFTHAEGIGEC